MKPDFEQRLNGKLEQASLAELMPDFDKEMEWRQLSERLRPEPKKGWDFTLFRAAAIFALVVGCGWLLWMVSKGEVVQPVTSSATISGSDAFSSASFESYFRRSTPASLPVAATIERIQNTVAVQQSSHVASVKHEEKTGREISISRMEKVQPFSKHNNPNKGMVSVAAYDSKGYICNGTPCPIQICISQTMKCKDKKPAAISTCSVLEPDQSGKLSYKAHDKVAKDCSLTVNEIEIKSITTGETIVLNAHSTPATAQEVFSYITGQKKGDVLAGVFRTDCDNHPNSSGIRIDNKFGDIILQ